jgi:hypothetical protein
MAWLANCLGQDSRLDDQSWLVLPERAMPRHEHLRRPRVPDADLVAAACQCPALILTLAPGTRQSPYVRL